MDNILSTVKAANSALLISLLCVLWLCTPVDLGATPGPLSPDILSRRIDLSLRQVRLSAALDEVAKKGQFEWSYNPKIIDPDQVVNLVANDWTIRETLYALLGDQYQFKVNGNYLIIKRLNKPGNEISGYIRDPKTGNRVANATVYDRQTLRATTTDSSGYYRLKVKKSSEIMVSRLGYRDTTLQVASNSPRYQSIVLQAIPAQPTELTTEESIQLAIRTTASDLERLFEATMDKWHVLNVQDSLHRRFQISLLPMIGTNHVLSGKVTNDWSVNILVGNSAGVRFGEVAGIGNFTRNRVRGVQVAGLFNQLRGNCTGIQLAGLYNNTGDTLHGIQAAGLVNSAFYTKEAVQVAGIANIAGKNKTGIAQAAGLFNLAGHIHVIQAAGVLNRASTVKGLQTAGLVNTVDTLHGVQISGCFNFARKVHGVQIGIFNSAKTVNGLQIGLLNRSGRRWMPVVNW